MEEPSGRTDNGIPTWQGQEAVRVGDGDPSHSGCCSHCPGPFSLSSQCSEFLWVENLISFVLEHIYWVHMKDNHKTPSGTDCFKETNTQSFCKGLLLMFCVSKRVFFTGSNH